MRSSLNTLIRQASGVSASWWLDTFGILSGCAAAAAILLSGLFVGTWERRLGAPTIIAIGICSGVVPPLLWRVVTARNLGRLLAARRSDRAGNDSSDFCSRFFTGVLHASNLSPDRCSAQDLQRAASHASAEFARFAARTATPASFVAFLGPILALVGGWNVARQAGPSFNAFQSMAPSMIAGIGCSALVVVLIELYILAMRNAPADWASLIGTSGIPHRAHQDPAITSSASDSGLEVQAGSTTSDPSGAVGMSLEEFRKLFDGPSTSNKA